ncbi:MAG: antibiotic biosynthesis monooxygenase, partial [Candidatus Contendobacter sp.]|nr:antibiotic biosynthesis monooxygenase [Candidatus Contendobacter sp.]
AELRPESGAGPAGDSVKLMTIAKFEALPETRTELLELVRVLAEHSRTDAGCLEYGCYQDITGADRLLIVGYWTDRQALEQHYESACFQELVGGRFATLVIDAVPSVSLYDVVEIDRL